MYTANQKMKGGRLGYGSFQKTGSCYVLVDDSGRTVAHVRGLRHLKLFRFAWDYQEAIKAIEAVCAEAPDHETVRKIKAILTKVNTTATSAKGAGQ